jgi:pyruvate kinase
MSKKTKIVATIGPASEDRKTLEKLISEGLNVVRLNFSHGDYQWHEKIIKTVREISEKMDMPVGILADLQGPRIRTIVEEDLRVETGEKIIITDVSRKTKASIPAFNLLKLDCPGIIKKLKTGNDVLIADGLIKLKVTKKIKDFVEAEVIDGGVIKNHKGVNIPDAKLPMEAMTKKDEEDLKFALKHDVDFVALSFVSNKKDISKLRQKIAKYAKSKKNLPQIVAKIERKEAIRNLNEIIKETDAVMVARGDLGIEMDEVRVAVLQKEIVEKSLRSGKPVIVATQMLGSMLKRPRPTRAEVSDVSNAVVDHADAVMLSEESAMGRYPVAAVKTMREIIEHTEDSPYDDLVHGFLGDARASVSAAVADSAHELSKNSNAKAIVVASVTGFTARMISRHRPQQQIFVMTNSEKTHNQLSLVWGAESFVLPDCKSLDELIIKSIETLKKKKLITKKDKIIIVAGRPHVKKEHMSLVKVEEIK